MISRIDVSNIARVIVSSGYAMRVDLSDVDEDIKRVELYLSSVSSYMKLHSPKEYEIAKKHVDRFLKLATSPGGSGHDQCLTGIRVLFDLKLSNKAWVDAERYKFLDFITSQSCSHRIADFDLDKTYNKYVDSRCIDVMKELKDKYIDAVKNEDTELAKKLYLKLLYNNPAGFELTASMSTNYRCLINIYKQRKNHRLPEWRALCEEIREFPLMDKLLG